MMSMWMSFRLMYVFSAVELFSYTIVPKMCPVSVLLTWKCAARVCVKQQRNRERTGERGRKSCWHNLSRLRTMLTSLGFKPEQSFASG